MEFWYGCLSFAGIVVAGVSGVIIGWWIGVGLQPCKLVEEDDDEGD